MPSRRLRSSQFNQKWADLEFITVSFTPSSLPGDGGATPPCSVYLQYLILCKVRIYRSNYSYVLNSYSRIRTVDSNYKFCIKQDFINSVVENRKPKIIIRLLRCRHLYSFLFLNSTGLI